MSENTQIAPLDAPICSVSSDGGPAFPVPLALRQADGQPMTAAEFFEGGNGMTLRDWFARETPTDEIQSMTYKNLSLMAQERLAGMKKPASDHNLKGDAAVDHQIKVMVFESRVNAALRYISADAMLAARLPQND